jgi:AcrR family transcriptional regulator
VPQPARERILDAAYACVSRYGIAKTTVEDAAREARVARATVYRNFPGGKDQLIRETISREAGRFFEQLAMAVAHADSFAELLEEALLFGHRQVEAHQVLQKILVTEPELLLPELTLESTRILAFIKTFIRPNLAHETLVAGVTLEQAVDHVARLLLSFVMAPGRWDLEDRTQVRELVRTELLSGILVPD